MHEKEAGDLKEFLQNQDIDDKKVSKIVDGLQMYKTEYLRFLDWDDIEESLGDLDTETKDKLLRLANEARRIYNG